MCRTISTAKFQSTPRFVGEGNSVRRPRWGQLPCFNPPPALSARGTGCAHHLPRAEEVSIHPPLCRRGELPSCASFSACRMFQSTPRFVGEGNMRRQVGLLTMRCFNPPPALSARGTPFHPAMTVIQEVSIHPPLCRRGERLPSANFTPLSWFQSTPRFVGEGNATGLPAKPRPRCFNPPPALSARGTVWPGLTDPSRTVSIHPPLCRRGEPGYVERDATRARFQSTPRFVGEGNTSPRSGWVPSARFNPPPALSARGTRSIRKFRSSRSCFNPPPALSARGTSRIWAYR